MLVLAILVATYAKAASAQEEVRTRYGFSELEIYELEDGIAHLCQGDVDGDGRTDLALANNARSRIDLLVRLAPDEEDAIDPDYDPEEPNALGYSGRFRHAMLPVEERIAALDLVDLDGDGRAEIVYGTAGGKVIVHFDLLGQAGAAEASGSGGSRGTQSSSRSIVRELDMLSSGIRALAHADADGDGMDDLVVAGESVVLLLGSDGRGGLRPASVLDRPSEPPSDARLVDLDGDGHLDLITIHHGQDLPLRMRFGQPAGGWSPRIDFERPQVRSSLVADVDGDGLVEICLVSKQSGRLSTLAVERSPHDSTAIVNVSFGPGEKDGARTFAVGDANGDGIDDVLVAHPEGAQLSVFLASRGTIALERVDSPSLVGVGHPCVGDIDGDGGNELVVISGPERAIGIGRIDSAGFVPFPRTIDLGAEPAAAALADLDADGIDDLVLVTARGRGRDREVRLEVRLGSPDGLEPETTQVLADLPKVPDALRLQDLDRDGRADALLFLPGSSEVPRVYLQTDAGFVADDRGEDLPGMGVLEGAGPESIAFVDADGDGVPELCASSGNFARSMYFERERTASPASSDSEGPSDEAQRLSTRVLEQFHAPSPGAKIQGCTAADLDGDGSLEIILLDGAARELLILERGQNGSMELRERIDALRGGGRGLIAVDLDGEGAQEILLLSDGGLGVLRRGPRTPELREKGTYDTKRPNMRLDRIAVGDFDADGAPDLAVTELTEHGVVVLRPDGAALRRALGFRVFETRTFAPEFESREPRELLAEDLDSDGLCDLALIVHDKLIVYLQEPLR